MGVGLTKRSVLELCPMGTKEISKLLVVDDVGGTFPDVELVLPAVGENAWKVDPMRATTHGVVRGLFMDLDDVVVLGENVVKGLTGLVA